MSDEYEPNLLDVAKLLYATSGEGPCPEVICLVGWLMERAPEVRAVWKTVNEPLAGSVTFVDLIDLHFCLHYEEPSEKAYGMAVWLLRRVPQTAALWHQLEQMGNDAGCLLQYPTYGIEALKYHADVDRLLATDWTTADVAIDAAGGLGPCYSQWLNIVEARLARGEGDVERLREVRGRLRAEAALGRQKPVLEVRAPTVVQIIAAKENREKLAEALDLLARALRSDEPATPTQAPS